MKKISLMLLGIGAMLLGSCGGNQFKVAGTLEGATDSVSYVLENASNGMWLIVDTVKSDNSGKFSVAVPAPQFPGIYRLRMGAESIYFPIDSLDNIQITSTLKGFATDYTLSGSDNAVAVMNVDKKARSLQNNPDSLTAWKEELATMVLAEPSGIVSYYIINKQVGGKPLFNPLDNNDLKVIGAVANAFNTFRPNDPRTQYMVNILLDGQRRRRQGVAQDTMYVTEVPIIEIDLKDHKGQDQLLSKVTTQGKVVMLCFTMQTAEFAPVLNKALSDVYRKYSSQGFEIYQVSYDTDEFQWRQSAANIPWISVYDPLGTNSDTLIKYNVYSLPTVYVINRKGELVERVNDVAGLESVVKKYI